MVVDVKTFDYKAFQKIKIQKRKSGNQGNKAKAKYKDITTAFDIETTALPEIQQSFMYIWQWAIGEDIVVVGRTWEEFTEFIEKITAKMKEDEYVVAYVHNLSYEFQFLRDICKFTVDDVFALDSRKVLKAKAFSHIEFRCSYIHSNMALKLYLEKMNAPHKKLDGDEFDYKEKRYPWTVLTPRQLEYCINDVVGLVEALNIEMAMDGDNLYTIPLTSTGYVRRDTKREMRKVSHNFVGRQVPDYELYTALREAFRGGNTHANRWYVGETLKNVTSADRSSSYPDVQCNCKFPISKFFRVGFTDFENVVNIITKREKAVVMRVSIKNIRLRDESWGSPYIPKDKCRRLVRAACDNGRILFADYLEMTITDIDFKIILDEYDFDDFVAFDLWHARYGNLPEPFINNVISYYKSKTELKGVEGCDVLYTKSKNKLNAIYGMSAQDPVKQNILFINGLFEEQKENKEDLLDKSNGRCFLPYQWGVWTTAWARYRLEEGIKLAGDGFVYADTDSVKYLGEIDWAAYNKARIKDSTKTGSFATDPSGVTHYMGVFEDEGTYEEFKTWGAKKYAYRKRGLLEATISGVTKDVWKKDESGKKVLAKMGGGQELESAGGLAAFKPGFVFRKAGGIAAVQNDTAYGTITVDGKELFIGTNTFLKDDFYTLGLAAEYEKLLGFPLICC